MQCGYDSSQNKSVLSQKNQRKKLSLCKDHGSCPGTRPAGMEIRIYSAENHAAVFSYKVPPMSNKLSHFVGFPDACTLYCIIQSLVSWLQVNYDDYSCSSF